MDDIEDLFKRKRGVMKSKFKDPIAIKNQKPKDKPVESRNSPWDFRCPEYDQRTSSFIKAGVNYGEGYTNPVGHLSNAKDVVETLPYGLRSQDLKSEE